MNWISIIPSHSINQEKAGCSLTKMHKRTHTQKCSADTYPHSVWSANFNWSCRLIWLVYWTKSDTTVCTVYRCVRECVCKLIFSDHIIYSEYWSTGVCCKILDQLLFKLSQKSHKQTKPSLALLDVGMLNRVLRPLKPQYTGIVGKRKAVGLSCLKTPLLWQLISLLCLQHFPFLLLHVYKKKGGKKQPV